MLPAVPATSAFDCLADQPRTFGVSGYLDLRVGPMLDGAALARLRVDPRATEAEALILRWVAPAYRPPRVRD